MYTVLSILYGTWCFFLHNEKVRAVVYILELFPLIHFYLEYADLNFLFRQKKSHIKERTDSSLLGSTFGVTG